MVMSDALLADRAVEVEQEFGCVLAAATMGQMLEAVVGEERQRELLSSSRQALVDVPLLVPSSYVRLPSFVTLLALVVFSLSPLPPFVVVAMLPLPLFYVCLLLLHGQLLLQLVVLPILLLPFVFDLPLPVKQLHNLLGIERRRLE